MTLDLKQYEKNSTLIWAVNRIQLPKGDRWDFSMRPWQLDIIDDRSKYICCRKPTQVGMSMVFLTKMLHFADFHQCRLMMTLPRQDDVTDMVTSRLGEIIKESPYVQERLQEVDNVRMKKFGKSWLHFAEMSVTPRMLDVDWLLNDEVDLSNPENLQQIISRLDASKLGFHHRISTPSIDDYGVDAVYKQSDQKMWVVTCAYCSHEQVMNWDMNVVHEGEETWYVCAACHNKIHTQDIIEGCWVSMGRGGADISGYQISQLMTPSISPNKLWAESQTISKKLFYNNRLGLPYTQKSANFDAQFIYENCFRSGHERETQRQNPDATYVLGCDQGNTLHVCIARVEKNDQLKIVLLTTIDFNNGFAELEKLIGRFKIRKAVIDALPNHHDARKIATESHGKVDVAYFTATNELYREDDEKCYINKTDAYDGVLQYILDGRLHFYDTQDLETKTAIAHICNMHRDVEVQTSKHGGITTFHTWKNTGPDHYADAILYATIAADIISSRGEFSVYDLDTLISNITDLSFETVYGIEPEISEPVVEGAVLAGHSNTESMMRLINNGLAPTNPYQMRSYQ